MILSFSLSELDDHINEIRQLCSLHKVKSLYAFGSVLTDRFNKNSDIDFIVDFEPIDIIHYADNYYELKFSLQDILHRSINLLEEKAVKHPYFKQVLEKQRKILYEY